MVPGPRATVRTVIFLHLPKTGGRTLTSVFRRQYGRSRVFEAYAPSAEEAIERYKDLSDEEKVEFRAIVGHVPITLHREVPGPCTYVTLLRHPIERVVSDYHYVHRTPSHPKHEVVRQEDVDLAAAVRSGIMPMLENGQTRVLSGWWGEYGECPPEAADRAMENIDRHVAVAGVTERFDESLLLMRRELGWSRRKTLYVSRNVSSDRPRVEDLPEETVDVIEEHNRVDMELYRRVRTRLDEAVADLGRPFSLAVAAFRGANRVYSRVQGLRGRLEGALEPERSAA